MVWTPSEKLKEREETGLVNDKFVANGADKVSSPVMASDVV